MKHMDAGRLAYLCTTYFYATALTSTRRNIAACTRSSNLHILAYDRLATCVVYALQPPLQSRDSLSISEFLGQLWCHGLEDGIYQGDRQALTAISLGPTAGRHHVWPRGSVTSIKIFVPVSGHTVSRRYGR